MKRIVVIDADVTLRPLYHELLGSEGYETVFCRDSTSAHRCTREADPDAIMLDLDLETRGAGWAVLASLKADNTLHDTPIIVCSADRIALHQHAGYLESQGCAMLQKPLNVDALLTIMEQMSDYPERPHRRLPVPPLQTWPAPLLRRGVA